MSVKLREYGVGSPGVKSATGPVIEGCKLLGAVSRNGRRYLPEAVQKAVKAGLYEGRACYVDHVSPGGQGRPFRSKVGRWVNTTCRDGEVWGDLKYNPRHPDAIILEGWLESDPTAVGFSHDASGSIKEVNGEQLVYEIESVESVDLVADPATTNGIHESENMNPLVPESPAATPADDSYETQIGKLVVAVLNDTAIEKDAKKKKILSILKLMDDDKGDPGEGDKPAEESDKPGEKDDEKKDDKDEAKEAYKGILAAVKSFEARFNVLETALKAKSPVSVSPATNAPKLTLDHFLTALNTGV